MLDESWNTAFKRETFYSRHIENIIANFMHTLQENTPQEEAKIIINDQGSVIQKQVQFDNKKINYKKEKAVM